MPFSNISVNVGKSPKFFNRPTQTLVAYHLKIYLKLSCELYCKLFYLFIFTQNVGTLNLASLCYLGTERYLTWKSTHSVVLDTSIDVFFCDLKHLIKSSSHKHEYLIQNLINYLRYEKRNYRYLYRTLL